MWPFTKKKVEKPRFRYLPNSGFWYYDNGLVLISSVSLETVYHKYMDYLENKDSVKWLSQELCYKEIKDNHLLMENTYKSFKEGG